MNILLSYLFDLFNLLLNRLTFNDIFLIPLYILFANTILNITFRFICHK